MKTNAAALVLLLAFTAWQVAGQTNQDAKASVPAAVDHKERQSVGRIGVEISLRSNWVPGLPEGPTVGRVYANSPASENGIKVGDFIAEIDSHTTKGLVLEDVARRIEGPIGSTVELTLIRYKAPKPLKMVLQRRLVGARSAADSTFTSFDSAVTNDVVGRSKEPH
jgi:C-terminal processing protease CtpA/Prc